MCQVEKRQYSCVNTLVFSVCISCLVMAFSFFELQTTEMTKDEVEMEILESNVTVNMTQMILEKKNLVNVHTELFSDPTYAQIVRLLFNFVASQVRFNVVKNFYFCFLDLDFCHFRPSCDISAHSEFEQDQKKNENETGHRQAVAGAEFYNNSALSSLSCQLSGGNCLVFPNTNNEKSGHSLSCPRVCLQDVLLRSS